MPSRIDARRPFPSRPRVRRRVPLLLLAAAVVLAACSQRSAPPDLAQVSAASPPPSPSPSPTEHPPAAANGTLVFSRALPAGVDGEPAGSVLRTLRPDGSTGPTVVEHAGYRAAPSWSPDGGSFAYLGDGGIWVWSAHGSSMLVPCHAAWCSGLGPPAWSPSGGSIAFGGERDGVAGILQVPSRGGDRDPHRRGGDRGRPVVVARRTRARRRGCRRRGDRRRCGDGRRAARLGPRGSGTGCQRRLVARWVHAGLRDPGRRKGSPRRHLPLGPRSIRSEAAHRLSRCCVHGPRARVQSRRKVGGVHPGSVR